MASAIALHTGAPRLDAETGRLTGALCRPAAAWGQKVRREPVAVHCGDALWRVSRRSTGWGRGATWAV